MAVTKPRTDTREKATETVSVRDRPPVAEGKTPPAYYQALLQRPDIRELLARLAKGKD